MANVALDLVEPELQSATRSADKYLDTGDALINQINTGEDASNTNARFAEAKIRMANSFQQESIARIEHSRGLVGLAGGYLATAQSMSSIALSYIREIEARILEARASIEVATADVAISNSYVNVGLGFVNNGRAYSENGRAYVDNGRGYLENGRGYLEAAANEIAENIAYINQMQQRIAEAQVYVNEATSYQTSAVSERESAAAFEAEAEKRLNTFFSILEDRRQIPQQNSFARQQYAQYQGYSRN